MFASLFALRSSLFGIAAYACLTGLAFGDTNLTPSEYINVLTAIHVIENSAPGGTGWPGQAGPLKKALQEGRICSKPTAGGACADTTVTEDTNYTTDTMVIRVFVGYLTDETSVDFLAGLLIHENQHHVIASGDDNGHCMVYWDEYIWLKELTSPSETAKKRVDQLEKKYPATFKDHCEKYELVGEPYYPPSIQNNIPARPVGFISGVQSKEILYSLENDGSINALCVPPPGGGLPTETTVATAIDVIRDAALMSDISGSEFMVVCGTGTGNICVLFDSNGDDVLDTSNTIVGSGSGLVRPISVTAVERLGGAVDWYALDAVSGNVWNLYDSDQDLIPDALGSIHANALLSPYISQANSLEARGNYDLSGNPTGVTWVAITDRAVDEDALDLSGWVVDLFDNNTDGVADATSAKLLRNQVTDLIPLRSAGGQAGDNFITILGTGGHDIDVLGWNIGSQDYTTTLASGSILPRQTYATLSAAGFLIDETFIIRDTDSGKESAPIMVTVQSPTVVYRSPVSAPISGGTVVTIRGYHFGSSPTVTVGGSPATVIGASDTSVDFELPPFAVPTLAEIVIDSGGDTVSGWYINLN